MVTIILDLDKDIEREAQLRGLLTSEKLGQMIEDELQRQRQAAAVRLQETMDKLSALMREEFGDLSEDEAQSLLNQWMNETDEEAEARLNPTTAP